MSPKPLSIKDALHHFLATFEAWVGKQPYDHYLSVVEGRKQQLCWFQTSLPLAALRRDHRFLFQSCSSQRQRRFGFTERHRSQVE